MPGKIQLAATVDKRSAASPRRKTQEAARSRQRRQRPSQSRTPRSILTVTKSTHFPNSRILLGSAPGRRVPDIGGDQAVRSKDERDRQHIRAAVSHEHLRTALLRTVLVGAVLNVLPKRSCSPHWPSLTIA